MADELNPSKCPRIKKNGLQCGNDAGKGTVHKGRGPCSAHGGRSPNFTIHFEREMVRERMATYGTPIDVEPHVALLQEVQRTAGHVAWLGSVVSEILHEGDGYSESIDDEGKRVLRPRTGLKQTDTTGRFEKPSVWVELYQEERRMLARVCKMALDAGVADRQVALYERQGELMAEVIKGILNDLGLSKEQQAIQGAVVRKWLLSSAAA